MAFKINIDKYAYSASPEKNTGNYAAELAKNLIAEEAELRAAADEKLKDTIELAVAEEASVRREAHNVLDERITLEVTRRTEGDNLADAKLTQEAQARESADNSLLAKINEETTARAAQDLLLRDEMTVKADKDDTYTKAEIDTITGNLQASLENSKADKAHTHTADDITIPNMQNIDVSLVDRINDELQYEIFSLWTEKVDNLVTVREVDSEGTFEKTDIVPNILDNLSYLVSMNERVMENSVLPELELLNDNKADKDDTYTKAEIDTITGNLQASLENSKADKADTYTKYEVESELSILITDIMHIGTIKADKSDTYTKTEIDNQIGDIETALDSIITIQNLLIGGDSV